MHKPLMFLINFFCWYFLLCLKLMNFQMKKYKEMFCKKIICFFVHQLIINNVIQKNTAVSFVCRVYYFTATSCAVSFSWSTNQPWKKGKKGKLPIKLCLPLIFTWNQIIESLKQQRRSESRKKQAGHAGQAELHCTGTVEWKMRLKYCREEIKDNPQSAKSKSEMPGGLLCCWW